MNEEYKIKQFLRKFSVSDLLSHFSAESIDIYHNFEHGTKFENKQLYTKLERKIENVEFSIGQWELIELCFYSIKWGNDYRYNVIDFNNHYNLISSIKRRSELFEKCRDFSHDDMLAHLICISNMQFDLQYIEKNNFNRIYYIMCILNKNTQYDQSKKVSYIDFSESFLNITNFKIEEYIKGYFFIAMLLIASKNSDIMYVINNFTFNTSYYGVHKQLLIDIVKYNAKEYDFYKKYDNWNILKYNPVVKTDKEEKYIITNVVAFINSFSTQIYWIIRNYYETRGEFKFTIYIGYCFEIYLNELFKTYEVTAEKLKEVVNEQRPDWKLETEKYVFYIEQKSGLYPMDTKTITSTSRLESLDRYIDNNLVKAFKQLNAYSESTNKIVIRICLTFEKIYFPEIIQDKIVKQISLSGEEHLNWIASIDDFEKLVYIYSKDEVEFNEIIDKKINLEKEKYHQGRGFEKLLQNIDNDYMLTKINYLTKITDDVLLKR